MPAQPPDATQANYSISVRFGDEVLQAGFTAIPNLVLEHYARLGITPLELVFTIHVWHYWWNERDPYPALNTIAERMATSRRQVRRYVEGLKEKGFLTVRERYVDGRGQVTSEYDFSGLIGAVLRLARGNDEPQPKVTSPPRSFLSQGGRSKVSGAPRTSMSSKEDEEQEDPHRRTSNLRKQPTPNRSAGTAPAANPNGAIAPATPTQRPQRARLPPAERRRYDADRRRIVDYLSDFARELGDAAPLASSVTRAVNLMRRAGVDLAAFTEALYHARAVTKERWAAVRKEERDPGRPFPRKQAMAYFFAELEHALGLRELPETPAEHAARKETEQQDRQHDRQHDRDRHRDWARATGPREWVQTYKPGEGPPASEANGGAADGA